MTNTNKKKIRNLVAELRAMQSRIDEIESIVSAIQDETQASYDNLSEYAQDGERGDKLQSEIDALDDAIPAIGGIDLDEAIQGLEGVLDA